MPDPKEREEMRIKIKKATFELLELINQVERLMEDKEMRASVQRARRDIQDEVFSVLVNMEKLP